jgi:predicted phosphodiesterase
VRFLILSDIHANWHALEAVLENSKGDYQEIVCCGDLVGYNANPDRVTRWVKENCAAVIRGNHDKVVAGIEDLEWFNDVARAAAVWTIAHMQEGERQYLHDLAAGPYKAEHFHMWHGSVADEDEYVTSISEATPHFAQFALPLAFFGHTHLQGGFFAKGSRVGGLAQVGRAESERTIELEPDLVYMVNPGSVGQPRDGDPRAAYALYDADRKLAILRRVEYPVEKTALEIQQAGLPEVLGIRLFHGF